MQIYGYMLIYIHKYINICMYTLQQEQAFDAALASDSEMLLQSATVPKYRHPKHRIIVLLFYYAFTCCPFFIFTYSIWSVLHSSTSKLWRMSCCPFSSHLPPGPSHRHTRDSRWLPSKDRKHDLENDQRSLWHRHQSRRPQNKCGIMMAIRDHLILLWLSG